MCDYCSWIDGLLATAKIEADEAAAYKPPPRKDPVIMVHGGAGRIPMKERRHMMEEVKVIVLNTVNDICQQRNRRTMWRVDEIFKVMIQYEDCNGKNAAIRSYTELVRGCHTLDAVVGAISHMESEKYFNCASGGSIDVNGEVVMDAGIMDSNFNGGCVGAVRDIEHPIDLARMVMQKTRHVLLVEKGAQKFAMAMGVPVMPPGWLIREPTPLPSIFSGGEEEGEEESGSIIGLGRYDPANYDDNRDTGWQTVPSTPEQAVRVITKAKKIAQCLRKNNKYEGDTDEEFEEIVEGDDASILLEPIMLQVLLHNLDELV